MTKTFSSKRGFNEKACCRINIQCNIKDCAVHTITLIYWYSFIYLTTILLQAVAWLVQFCRVTSSFQNTARVNSQKKHKQYVKRIHCFSKIYYNISETRKQR